jgi:hypothetical protein
MTVSYGERGEVFAGVLDAQQRGRVREVLNLKWWGTTWFNFGWERILLPQWNDLQRPTVELMHSLIYGHDLESDTTTIVQWIKQLRVVYRDDDLFCGDIHSGKWVRRTDRWQGSSSSLCRDLLPSAVIHFTLLTNLTGERGSPCGYTGDGCTAPEIFFRYCSLWISFRNCLTEQVWVTFTSIFIQQTTKSTISKLFPYIPASTFSQISWLCTHWIKHKLAPKLIRTHCQSIFSIRPDWQPDF